ncbi:tumor protein D52 isoform X3 [Strongylocentrotus purpuratus]|uniref:Tumor protein D52 n=1 Tax=Strongylocentrotus purpuratus TaxID=7668 RepID=A0A7M7HG89_STRPU|nr:tumor protein D52 isoform X3 [Strongylocentrotus purpuratus]|eukprot:XP_011673515.1 PREDICTED: tumor protein D52 isoform X3 [Strongylocentrotus purpuratus]
MEPPSKAGCDIGVQTTTPSLNSLSPILDHRLYNFDDGDSEWSFLDMEKTQPSDNNKRTSARPKSARMPQDGSSQSVPSPEEDGYCSQEELGNELQTDDQSYKSPLKDAPSYSTYLALVPDLHVDGADSEPESPHDEDTISTATSATDTSTTPAITVSDDQAGGLGRDDSTPLFEQSPASTPSELASPTNENLNIDDAERERLKTELAEVELDVEALRQTLRAKEMRAKEIRRKLGITQVAVLKSDVRAGWTNFKQSSAYNKTKTGFQSAGQKTGAAFSSFGSAVTKKLGEVRESTAFKSFEDKVSTTATTLKTKVAGQKPDEESSFEDVLQSTANERTPDPQPNPPLPEEKVPM